MGNPIVQFIIIWFIPGLISAVFLMVKDKSEPKDFGFFLRLFAIILFGLLGFLLILTIGLPIQIADRDVKQIEDK